MKGMTRSTARYYRENDWDGYIKQGTYADLKELELQKTLKRQRELNSQRTVTIKIKRNK